MNSEKIQGKINNLSNYLQYCESLKHILETSPIDDFEVKKKHIKEVQATHNNLETVDLHIDFFDEMNGVVNDYETKNMAIKQKIDELKRNF